jgi:electron transfer flavoprotein alpha subunit
MALLVIAEHDNKNINPATLCTVSAAAKLGQNIALLIAGSSCSELAQSACQIEGVTEVLNCDHPAYEHRLAENMAALVVNVVNTGAYTHILAPASFFGKNLAPRVAALLDLQQISDVIEIESEDTFIRPIYAGNALAKVKSLDATKILTIRPTAFDPALQGQDAKASVTNIEPAADTGLSQFVKEELTKSERPDLGTASVVVSGGRGLGSAENYENLILPLSDLLGAAAGASRAAVDAGWVPNDQQVGQTGKVVAPELYIAIGISGAIQHLAGMKDSKIIVAINKDEEAPIFEVADYGLVADLFDAVPQLMEALGGSADIQKSA